jgi:hypothetical protein
MTTNPIMDVVIVYMGPFIVGVPKREKKDLRTFLTYFLQIFI